MSVYRIELILKSPFGTDLVSGTMWGHLAWAIRYLEGEKSLVEWLEDQENHPWLLSTQMPVGMLPRPLLKPSLSTVIPKTLEEMGVEKAARKIAYIRESLFERLRGEMNDEKLREALKEELASPDKVKRSPGEGTRAHNTIDRLSGTTPETGGLFFEPVTFPDEKARCQLFLGTPEPCLEKIRNLFAFVGESGFGCNASTGNGQFTCSVTEATALFAAAGNRAMSLSHGVLTKNMSDARYKQHVHFGKLGGDYAKGGFSPFKFPILMARPGATFAPFDSGPFGAMLRGIHHDPALQHIRHHGFHLPLFFTEVRP